MTRLLRSLLYHRIGDPRGVDSLLSPDLISATPAEFEAQMAMVTRRYTPVSAEDVVAAVERSQSLPRGAILITFDDGYQDFAEVAWPILRRWRVPAVLFLATAYPDTTDRLFWWDKVWQGASRTDRVSVDVDGLGTLPLTTQAERRAASARLAGWLKTFNPVQREARLEALLVKLGVKPEWTPSVSSWSELRKLASDGATIAGHTQTHPLLDQVDSRTLEDEVLGCRDDLIREIGTSPPMFAYPNGNFDRRMPSVLARGGFAAGFTTMPGLNLLGRANPAYLRREDGRSTVRKLQVKLLEPIGRLRAWQRQLPR
jgi:peptidoglycan/xylan/chitin deacetylase (PgdA/CDA1 family)